MTALISGGFAAYVVKYTWQTNMGMLLVESYELQLQYLNGTAISSYDWGVFSPGEAKDLDCLLNYTGNAACNVTWDTVGFPTGWSIGVTILNYSGIGGDFVWTEASYEVWSPGQVEDLRITITEDSGVPDQPETFTLNIQASEYTP